MKKMLLTAACVLALSTTYASAQSSMGKGGAAQTGESADPSKTPGGTNMGSGSGSMGNSSTTGTGGMSQDGMKKDGMSGNNMKKDGMSKDGMKK